MATIDGARAMGMEKEIGSLEPGKRADLIVVSMSAARQTPMYDPLSHLVYVTRGDDVRTTIVNGKVLMRDRKVLTLNARQVLADAALLRRARSAPPSSRAQHDHHQRSCSPKPRSHSASRTLAAEIERDYPGRRGDPPGRRPQGGLHVHGGPGPRHERSRDDGLHGGVELRQGHDLVRPGAGAEGSRQQPRRTPRHHRRGHRRHRADAALPAGSAEGARAEDR